MHRNRARVDALEMRAYVQSQLLRGETDTSDALTFVAHQRLFEPEAYLRQKSGICIQKGARAVPQLQVLLCVRVMVNVPPPDR